MCDHRLLPNSSTPGEIDHVHFLSEDIGNLYENEDCSDIVLVVGGESFHAHKVILASRCEYFRALLYGGMRESQPGVQIVELKDERPQAFSALLSYIYTGKVKLNQLKEEQMLDLLGMANKYGFQALEAAISDYLKISLSLKNVCTVYDMASVYSLERLRNQCLEFMDRNACDVVKSEAFINMNKSSLIEVINRSSFAAAEIDIFDAVVNWSARNNDMDIKQVLQHVRFSLMSMHDLLRKVRQSHLVDPNEILDAVDRSIHSKNTELNFRGMLIPEENVASLKHDAQVVKGEMKQALLDGDINTYDLDRGFTRHGIDDDDTEGIIVKLGQPAIINTINMLLWDKDQRSYAYYVEVSMDAKDWVRVVDHRKYLCRSWQRLHFEHRVVKYIKIVGTHNTVNRVFHVVALEASYTQRPFRLRDKLIEPTENVATEALSAFVIEGVARTRNSLINGDVKNYDWDSGYTCHQIGHGAIVVQLAQPYYVGSLRLLLWDCDNRAYCYTVEVSVDNNKWSMIKDNSSVPCKSWQVIRFNPRPVVFIRIIGTKNTANEVFHLVHFECPAERSALLDPFPSSSPSSSHSKSLSSPLSSGGKTAAHGFGFTSVNNDTLTESSPAAICSSPQENMSPLQDPFLSAEILNTSLNQVSELAPPSSPSSGTHRSTATQSTVIAADTVTTAAEPFVLAGTDRGEAVLEGNDNIWADLTDD